MIRCRIDKFVSIQLVGLIGLEMHISLKLIFCRTFRNVLVLASILFTFHGSLRSSSWHKVLGYGVHIPSNVFPSYLGRSHSLLDNTHKLFANVL